ncbi:MAG: hypothetical protein ACLGGX_02435 [Bdellovibrionia bacterium]
MKNAQNTNEVVSIQTEVKSSPTVDMAWTHQEYHEMADVPVVQNDGITQLHAQLAQLEDLQKRLAFVMREVRYLIKA